MERKIPRIILAAASSGSGKTTITCGILQLLKNRGLKVAAFKSGPDYIDPMFHSRVLNTKSRNLDTYFTDDNLTNYLLSNGAKDTDISVIEGVMGMYDGLAGKSIIASTYHLGKVTNTPIILIVNCKGSSVSLLPLIKGMNEYKQKISKLENDLTNESKKSNDISLLDFNRNNIANSDNDYINSNAEINQNDMDNSVNLSYDNTDKIVQSGNISGVILNQVSPSIYPELKEMIELQLRIPVVGYVPVIKDIAIDSRHLGLVRPDEISDIQGKIEKLADIMSETIDLDILLKIAKEAPNVIYKSPKIKNLKQEYINFDESTDLNNISPVLAIARDEAFNFYYADNIDLIQKMGAKVIYFSPIHDESVPEKADGILLGGGYPENYGELLERNISMKNSIKSCIEHGMPCIAECGGYMYLHDTLEGSDGIKRKMVGAIKGDSYRTDTLRRFGYIELEARVGNILCDRGATIKGHEFHYWDSTNTGADFCAKKPLRKTTYDCIIANSRLIAGFPHLYYYSNPDFIYEFLRVCLQYKSFRESKNYWDAIAKPIYSLGLLEDNVSKIAFITGKFKNISLEKRALIIMCADHRVICEGVTQTDSSVTKIVSENFAKSCSSVNYMSEVARVDAYPIDIGMDTEPYPTKSMKLGAVIDRKINRGSNNIAKEAAMTVTQCKQALQVGIDCVKYCKEMNYDIVATGEMGIGNTTPTSILASVLLGETAETVTGRGAGLSQEGFDKKINVVRVAVKRVKEKKLTDIIDILSEVGGYDIAGIAGVFLGGVRYKLPIVIDGAISAIAALVAYEIDKRVADYAIGSHQSKEIVERLALEKMKVKAMISCNMSLGEGSGAVAIMPLLDMALNVYNNMSTFKDNSIKEYEKYK